MTTLSRAGAILKREATTPIEMQPWLWATILLAAFAAGGLFGAGGVLLMIVADIATVM